MPVRGVLGPHPFSDRRKSLESPTFIARRGGVEFSFDLGKEKKVSSPEEADGKGGRFDAKD